MGLLSRLAIVAIVLAGLILAAAMYWFRRPPAEPSAGLPIEQRESDSTPTQPTTLLEPPSHEQPAEQAEPMDERDDGFAAQRRDMVQWQMRDRDIVDERVLRAMERVPRHQFVPDHYRQEAYWDGPLPIGHGQTISQPYIVALMTQLAEPEAGERALDVGTGSGYQAAVLAELLDEVYSIEIVEPLAESARQRLQSLGYQNVTVRAGDGYRGWPEHAPFDVIILAAAPDHVPQPLIDQLAPGGKLVLPVGQYYQELVVIEKDAAGKTTRRNIAAVAFVPMTGEAQK